MSIALVPTWLQEFEKEAGYMTKQEGIEKAIKEHIQACLDTSGFGVSSSFAESISKSLPVLLDGLGVVIKVEGKEVAGCSIVDKTNALCPYKEAGYGAFESLI